MSRGPCTFRQRDVESAIKAACAAGLKLSRVEIGKDGKIVLVANGTEHPAPADANEWDNEK